MATQLVYRIVTVEAADEDTAKRRAKLVVKNTDKLRAGEDVGYWCDSSEPEKPRVLRVVTP